MSISTFKTWTADGRLDAAAERVRRATDHLAAWSAGQPVQGLPADAAGHNALTAIDSAVLALEQARTVLVRELQRGRPGLHEGRGAAA